MKNKFKGLAVLLFGIISVGFNILFFLETENLQNQIDNRDKLIQEKLEADSNLALQSEKNINKMDQYFDGCGILINGTRVSTEDLLNFIKNKIEENEKLQEALNNTYSELNYYHDSLMIYKSFAKLAKDRLDIDFSVSGDSAERYLSINMPQDSLTVYKKITEIISENYGIKYNFETRNNEIFFKKEFSQVDSALMIYDYYKDKLYKNAEGSWIIILPNNEEKNSKRGIKFWKRK